MKGEQPGTVRLDVVLTLAHMPIADVPLCLNAQWACLDDSGESATTDDYRNLGEFSRALLKSNLEFH